MSGLLEDPNNPGAMVHETSCVDEGASIGSGTRIWHFSHVMTNCKLGIWDIKRVPANASKIAASKELNFAL